MPALDACHSQIVHALEKAGWIVSLKPFTLPTPINNLYIDIQAHHAIPNGSNDIIVVEAKCFTDDSFDMHELYVAIGQYLVYKELLEQQAIPRALYLAIPVKAYYGIFRPLAMNTIMRNGIRLIVVELEKEEVAEWIVP